MASLKDLTKTKKLSQIEKALLQAQSNAALPIAQGGLGLSALNTPEERAAAMGAVDYLHGTQRLDRLLQGKSLDPRRATSGPMPFGTESPELASSYAMGKPDTSRIATDEGNMSDYFQVSPQSLGRKGSSPTSVEQSYYELSPQKKHELLKNYYRVGYEDPDEAMGKLVLHPEGSNKSIAGKQHLDYVLQKEAKGNPLTALRILWGESGEIYDEPQKLADIYKVAGYPHEISQANAPWFEAKGVLTGKAMVQNPLQTQNHDEILSQVVPALEQAFKSDRSRKVTIGADPWDKRARFTPKEWVDQLKSDLSAGENSYVWTSIPDKVTAELKKLGYDSILDISGKGGSAEKQVVIPFEPSQVRSRFAAFDPMRRNEANLLASHPLASAGAALAATGGLSGMAKQYLDQPMDMGPEVARVANYTGKQPMSRGEALRGAVSAVPGIGDVLSGVEGLQAASEGKWGEAGLSALGALPMVSGAIKASHGSPHAFKRFDLSKMGTGEGAQAYGHGAYFGQGFDSPVAQEYRKNLSKDFFDVAGNLFDPRSLQHLNVRSLAGKGDLEGAIKKAQDIAIGDSPVSELAKSDLSSLLEIQKKGGLNPASGHMYTVSLEWPNAAKESADPLGEHHLLDWDAPYEQQPIAIQKLLQQYRDEVFNKRSNIREELNKKFAAQGKVAPIRENMSPITGQQLYDRIASELNSRQLASHYLANKGIPGLKYLDQGSRGANEGTRNYVIFDENIPRIVSRNGVSLTDLLRK